MATCPYCGCELEEGSNFCYGCSSELETDMDVYSSSSTSRSSNDSGSFWWGLLGCCIPLVGLIMFFVWHDSKPKTAKALGIGALVSVIIALVLMVGLFGLGAALVTTIVEYLS